MTAEAEGAFSAALEQAEAYHRASLSAGPAVSPTLLYYSLIQFGRAMHFVAGGGTRSLPGRHGLAGDKPKRVEDPPAAYPRAMRGPRGELPEGSELPERPPVDRRVFDRAIRSFLGPDSTFDHVQGFLGETQAEIDSSLEVILSGHPDCADLFVDLRENRPVAMREVSRNEDDYVRQLSASGLVLQILYGPDELDDDEIAERFRGIPFPANWESGVTANISTVRER